MAALLVSIAVMGILASVAMPVWRQSAQREKEAELVFRAGQYAHAIEKFKRKYANQYPPDVDVLINQKFLRKRFKDPMTKDGEWRIVTPAELQGVPVGPGSPTPGLPSAGGSSSRNSFSSPPSSQGSYQGRQGGPGSSQGQSPFSTGSPQQQPGTTSGLGASSGSGRTINVGPIAAVASKSTARSIRIFKGRDRYDQWIVTIDDVARRLPIQPQQPNQPNQPNQPSRGPGSRPSSPFTPQQGPSTPPRP